MPSFIVLPPNPTLLQKEKHSEKSGFKLLPAASRSHKLGTDTICRQRGESTVPFWGSWKDNGPHREWRYQEKGLLFGSVCDLVGGTVSPQATPSVVLPFSCKLQYSQLPL